MDEKTTKKTTISDLAAEAAKAKKETEQTEKPKKSKLPIIIILIILLIGLGVALFFILRKPTESGTTGDTGETESDSEIVWKAPEDSIDPAADYVSDKTKTIEDSSATDDEKFQAKISIANLYSASEKYDEAETTLNEISRDGLTKRQLFSLYSAYAYLYNENHRNDANAYKEYSELVEQTLNEYWDEEDGEAPSDDAASSTEE